MPIKTNCPACSKPYTLADNQAGKRVRCRNCAETFAVPGGDEDIPTVEFADKGPPLRGAVAKAPSMGGPAMGAPVLNAESVDDDRPVHSKSGSLVLPLVIGGIALFLLLLLGGGGLAIYLIVSKNASEGADKLASSGDKKDSDDKDKTNGIEIKQGGLANQNNKPIIINQGGGNPPVVVQREQDPDLRTPEDALARLRNSTDHFARKRAVEWLQHQPVDPDKQGKIAKSLEQAYNQESDVFVKGDLIKVLALWATKEQIPLFIRLGDADVFNNERGQAMDVIVRLKDTANVGFIVKNLNHAFAGQKAAACLSAMGKDAEGEVLKCMNHPDKGARDRVLDLLRQYNTSDADMLSQSIKDLNNAVDNPTASPIEAANYLAKVTVVPEQQQDVARSLEKLFTTSDQKGKNAALRALSVWGTPDSIPTMGLAMRDPGFGNFDFPLDPLISALLRMKEDPRAARALVVGLTPHGDSRTKSGVALRTMGPAAEDAVIWYWSNFTDHFAKVEALKVLAAVGTNPKGIRFLTQLDASGTERNLHNDIVAAATLIKARSTPPPAPPK
jgi:hypothetical protein